MTHITRYGQFEKDFMNDQGMLIAGGENHGLETIFKFGHNPAVGTTFGVVSDDGIYHTPKSADAVAMRIKAGGNAADTAAGTGARAVTFIGIGPDGAQVSETVATAGALASAPTTQLFMRVYRAFVSDVGVYSADMNTGSHAAAIVIEDTAGQEWATILSTDFPEGQTQIAAFTFGVGQRGYLSGIHLFVASTKVVDFLLLQRNDILMDTTEIKAVRLVAELNAAINDVQFHFEEPIFFPPLTDVALLARVPASTAAVNAQMTFVVNEN